MKSPKLSFGVTIGGLAACAILALHCQIAVVELNDLHKNLNTILRTQTTARMASLTTPAEMSQEGVDPLSLDFLRQMAYKLHVPTGKVTVFPNQVERQRETLSLASTLTASLLDQQSRILNSISIDVIGLLVLGVLLFVVYLLGANKRENSPAILPMHQPSAPLPTPLPAVQPPPVSMNIRDLEHSMQAIQYELRAAQESLMQSTNLSHTGLRSALIQSPIGLMVLKQDLSIDYVNKAITDLTGLTEDNLKNTKFNQWLSIASIEDDHGVPRLPESLKDAEGSLLTATGQRTAVEVTLSPFASKSGKKFILNLIDVSHRAELLRARKDTLAEVSHDLKGPLGSLRLFLTMISDGLYGELPNSAKTAIDRVVPELDRLIRLSQNILSAETIDGAQVKLDIASHRINRILNEAVTSVQGSALTRNQRVVIELDEEDTPCLIDAERIVQVLVNLLGNAIKYSPTDTTIRLSAKRSAEDLTISVVDEGPGIPAEECDQIFNKFERGNRAGAGAGIGLWVSKRLVELHGGTIGVSPADAGTGTKFWFTLPIAR